MAAATIIARLVLAAVCAGIIGLERETAQKAAGLRTHVLVGVGAAMFTMTSIAGFEGADTSRVAAQIVTGIGFLGAGAIFREGQFVSGLTTAAGLWTVAALGMAAGSGSYLLAVFGTTVAVTVLLTLHYADEAVRRRTRVSRDRLEVTIHDTEKLQALLKFVRHIDPDATQLAFERSGSAGGVLTLAVDRDHTSMVSEMLASHKTVSEVELLSPLHQRDRMKE